MCQAQTLQLGRRYYCDREQVADFLIGHKPLFSRDRRLIWNADETELDYMKPFRVFCQRWLLPFVAAMDTVPHLSGIVSISGGGNVLKSIVIRRNLQNVGDLSALKSHCNLEEWMDHEGSIN
jgi:hypothetical protein